MLTYVRTHTHTHTYINGQEALRINNDELYSFVHPPVYYIPPHGKLNDLNDSLSVLEASSIA